MPSLGAGRRLGADVHVPGQVLAPRHTLPGRVETHRVGGKPLHRDLMPS